MRLHHTMAREDASIFIPFHQRKGQERSHRFRKPVVEVRQASFKGSDILQIIKQKFKAIWEIVALPVLKQLLRHVVRDPE